MPFKGARGPLTRIRARPGDPPRQDGQPCYRLADYLEQTGRRDRAGTYPPASFWAAVSRLSDRDILYTLGQAAHTRGLYRTAAQLWKNATTNSNPKAAYKLLDLMPDYRAAQHAARHVTLDDPGPVASVLERLQAAGAHDQVTVLLARDPARNVALDDPSEYGFLLKALRAVGAHKQVAVLADRAARSVALDPRTVAYLLRELWAVGARKGGGAARA
jgi:hypothetical protein